MKRLYLYSAWVFKPILIMNNRLAPRKPVRFYLFLTAESKWWQLTCSENHAKRPLEYLELKQRTSTDLIATWSKHAIKSYSLSAIKHHINTIINDSICATLAITVLENGSNPSMKQFKGVKVACWTQCEVELIMLLTAELKGAVLGALAPCQPH